MVTTQGNPNDYPVKCPCCNTLTSLETRPDGSEEPVCPECGWVRERSESDERPNPRTLLFYLRFLLMWVITLVLIAGPYIGLRYLFHELDAVAPLADDALEKLNLYYGGILAAYLAACWALSPEYDHTNLGIFGGNPLAKYNPAFTPEQHYNRFMRTLSGLLMPGKIILATLRTTFEVVRPSRT